MSTFVDRPEVSMLLTLLFVYQVFSRVKPLIWNAYARLTLMCTLIGATLVQLLLVSGLYAVYRVALPLPAAGDSHRVEFVEFVSLNVTMTSLYACGLLLVVVVASGLVATWATQVAQEASECLPYLKGGDHCARAVSDLRYKVPMK